MHKTSQSKHQIRKIQVGSWTRIRNIIIDTISDFIHQKINLNNNLKLNIELVLDRKDLNIGYSLEEIEMLSVWLQKHGIKHHIVQTLPGTIINEHSLGIYFSKN